MAKKRQGFSYRENEAAAARRASSSSSDYDNPISGAFKVWSPSEGKNRIRILPRTWSEEGGPLHWAFEAFIHYSIGADKGAYLCLSKMRSERCPVCEERQKLAAAGDVDGAGELRPGKAMLVWMIDRRTPEEGPVIWKMPSKSVHTEICLRSEDDETGELFKIDHPDEGFDVLFRRTGTGKNGTSYTGVDIARSDSPISDDEDEMDEWLDYIEEHPIPATLNYFDAEYLDRVFSGHVSKSDDMDDEPPSRTSRRSRSSRDDDEPSRSSRRSSRDDDEEGDDDEPTPRSRRRSRKEEPEEEPRRSRSSRDEEVEPRTRRRRSEPEDGEGEDGEEDEEPRRRERSPGRSSSKRGARGDDDLDELDEPEEEPKRSRSRSLRDDVDKGLKRRKRR